MIKFDRLQKKDFKRQNKEVVLDFDYKWSLCKQGHLCHRDSKHLVFKENLEM